MATFPRALLNLNTWRVLTAGFLLALGNIGSPFWWIAAVPWFVLNLPGLLLTTIPAWLVLAAGPHDYRYSSNQICGLHSDRC